MQLEVNADSSKVVSFGKEHPRIDLGLSGLGITTAGFGAWAIGETGLLDLDDLKTSKASGDALTPSLENIEKQLAEFYES